MSDENTNSVTLTVVTQESNPTFLTENTNLKKLLKDVTKASKEAIEVLIKCMTSNDEKVAMQAATKLLEFQVSIAKEINADQMQRLIAEIKLNRGPQGRLIPANPEGEDTKNKRPTVDFTTVRTV